MSSGFTILAIIVMLAVVAVLFAGLRNLMKGGSGNTSNKLMQARVVCQGLAIVFLVLALNT